MCGLFGLVRAAGAAHPRWATEGLLLLGVLAEERGVDGAGYALVAPAGSSRGGVRADAARFARTQVGRVHVAKGPGRFSQVWRPTDLDATDGARIVLGHTRWATQGGVGKLLNTSPMVVAGAVGTHNGDLDADRLAALFGIRARRGDTDSEVLLAALAAASSPQQRRLVLTASRGRASVAWLDVARPGRLWLARAAISPLAVAQDAEGNVFWASNPAWLRRVEQRSNVRMVRRSLLPEGSLLSVDHGPAPAITSRGRFTATARARDARLADMVAYRGFTAADRQADLAQRCCRVERDPSVAGQERWSRRAGDSMFLAG